MGANINKGSKDQQPEQDQKATQDVSGAANPQEQREAGNDSSDDTIGQELDQIDRDKLPENMRGAYDTLVNIRDGMNKSYTTRMQKLSKDSESVSDMRRKSEALDVALQHPVIGPALVDLANNRPVNLGKGPSDKDESIPIPDPEENPIEYVIYRTTENVDTKLNEMGKRFDRLESSLQGINSYIGGSQDQLEYDNLVSSNPSAKNVSLAELNDIQTRYSKRGGGRLSLREALGLYAVDNPDVMSNIGTPPGRIGIPPEISRPNKATTVEGGNTPTGQPMSIETQSSGSIIDRLRDKMKRNEPLTFDAAIKRAMEKDLTQGR